MLLLRVSSINWFARDLWWCFVCRMILPRYENKTNTQVNVVISCYFRTFSIRQLVKMLDAIPSLNDQRILKWFRLKIFERTFKRYSIYVTTPLILTIFLSLFLSHCHDLNVTAQKKQKFTFALMNLNQLARIRFWMSWMTLNRDNVYVTQKHTQHLLDVRYGTQWLTIAIAHINTLIHSSNV